MAKDPRLQLRYANYSGLIGPNGSPCYCAKPAVTYSTTTPPTAFNFDALAVPSPARLMRRGSPSNGYPDYQD